MTENQYFDKIKKWIEEEFKEVQIQNQESNPGLLIQFKFANGHMGVAFEDSKPDKATILRGINIDTPHKQAFGQLDGTYRKQLRHDLNYEFSSYNIPFNTKYDGDNILQLIQFTMPIFDDQLSKNQFIEKVFLVFNAGFRVIAYINKELN